jgi:hypothetical protein
MVQLSLNLCMRMIMGIASKHQIVNARLKNQQSRPNVRIARSDSQLSVVFVNDKLVVRYRKVYSCRIILKTDRPSERQNQLSLALDRRILCCDLCSRPLRMALDRTSGPNYLWQALGRRPVMAENQYTFNTPSICSIHLFQNPMLYPPPMPLGSLDI